MKNSMTKSQKQIAFLTAFAAVATISGALQYGREIVELADNLSDSGDRLSDFMQGASASLNLTSFLMIIIIQYIIYKGVKLRKVFSGRLIYFVQAFGFTKIAATCCYAFSQGGTTSAESVHIIIGLLIVIFAQIFKIAYKMQQEEELTV